MDPNGTEEDHKIQRYICEMILKTRKEGHNGIPVVFPKLVYLYSAKQHEDPLQQQLFEKAVQCSAEAMYPDYLAIDSDHGTVSDVYKKTGKIISPMGCRAFLSRWDDPETGETVTIGRSNIGAISINLPLLWEVATHEHPGDPESAFFELLDSRMEMARQFHLRKYEVISNMPASSNPMCFCMGGLYHGNRKPHEKVGNLVDYMTASFGYIGLHELTELAKGKSIYEDHSEFALKVLRHMNSNIKQYKEQDHHLWALYGTPAESYCGTAAKQVKDYLIHIGEDHRAVKVPEYLTNSFHMHVSEDITPIEKQDAEFEAFHLSEGGHIQYVRIDDPSNIEGMKAIIERGTREKGFYQGVNFDSQYCNHCHEHSVAKNGQILKCSKCGSPDVVTISRVCGYLGYSSANGSSRFNNSKLSELKDRRSM